MTGTSTPESVGAVISSGIELRDLRVFLTLAEELHFGRTAERVGINHSRVSQIIRTLEGRLGGRLFDRTSRRVRLTPLGERLMSSVQPAYELMEQALRDAREAASGIAGALRVGSYFALSLGPHWVRIVSEFESRHPTCRVEFVDTGIQRNYLAPLRSGELDMVASRLPLTQPDISIGPVLSHERRVLIIAKHDPLALRESVSVEDFADRPVVGGAAGSPTEMFDAFVPPVAPSGRRLHRVPPTNVEETRVRVARGELAHATVQSVADQWAHPNTTYVTISDLPPSETALVWLTANRSPKIDTFVRAAAEVLADTELAAYQPQRPGA
jgi:DNA-binding transcriptional LysR family regulator